MLKTLAFLFVLLFDSLLIAQGIPNWTVPPYAASTGSGITPMTDATPPRAFVGVEPCRLVDTRAGSGFPAGFGAPSLAPGVPRTFDLNNGPCPGLPTLIVAYSLNITVTNTQGPGFILIYPQGGAQPTVSTLNYVAGQTIANAAIVPRRLGEGVTVVAGVSGTDLIIDINGYFSETPDNAFNSFEFNNNSSNRTAHFSNQSPACNGICGVLVSVVSGSALSAFSFDGGSSRFGVNGTTSGSTDSAGVIGQAPTTTLFPPPGRYSAAGVRGQGQEIGVLGISRARPVTGDLIDSEATSLARGTLGFDGGAVKYGVYAEANYGGSGAKFFVEPHPTDASKVIRYVSLEGPEAGTYFRGKAKFERGVARIAVPEDFRMVTDAEGLTVQITPIGPMAATSVVRYDLNEIVVQSSRNVEFFYLVNGVRRTHKQLTPIGEGIEYRPERADSMMPAYLTEGQKQLLIQNGTYKPDGTVNMETARRLGWDKVWAERERPRTEPTPE